MSDQEGRPVAEDIGSLAAAVYGGETPFEPEPAEHAG